MSEIGAIRSSDHLKPQAHECIKQHFVYDDSGRMTEVYTAHIEALHGRSCMLTQYAYDGATNRVIFHKESLSTWDSAWDIL
jgi:hypothetical protein